MKYLNKLMVFFLSILFCYGMDTFGYTYTVANMSGRNVKIRLHYAFGKLNKKDDLVEAYDTREFSFGGWEIGLCLTKIIASSFDKEIGKWIKLPVPMKTVDRDSFDKMKNSIRNFNGAVKKIGKGAALAGPKGVILSEVINGVADLADSLPDIWEVSLCRSRDFILVLDYDPLFRVNRVYALTPPE